MGFNIFFVGILSTVFVALQIISSLYSGHLSEKYGHKKIIIISAILYALAWLSLSFAQYSFLLLFFVYILAGIGAGLFEPISTSTIAQISEDNNRSKNIADFGAAGDLGRILLSAFATSLIGFLDWKVLSFSFTLIVILVLLNLIFIKGIGTHTKVEPNEKTEKINYKYFLESSRYKLVLLTGVLDSFASSSLYIFIPFLLQLKGIPLTTAGLVTSLFFVGYFFGRILLGRLADRYGKVKVLIYSEIIMAFLVIILALINSLYLVGVILFLLGAFTRGTSPIIKAMVGQSLKNKEGFDKGYSLYSFSSRSSLVVSRTVYGAVSSSFGVAAVFYLSSIVVLSVVIPALKFEKIKE